MQKVQYIYAGINYTRNDGTSKAKDFIEEWKKQHPNAQQFFGNFRELRNANVKKYAFTTYEYHQRGGRWFSDKEKTIIARFIEG